MLKLALNPLATKVFNKIPLLKSKVFWANLHVVFKIQFCMITLKISVCQCMGCVYDWSKYHKNVLVRFHTSTEDLEVPGCLSATLLFFSAMDITDTKSRGICRQLSREPASTKHLVGFKVNIAWLAHFSLLTLHRCTLCMCTQANCNFYHENLYVESLTCKLHFMNTYKCSHLTNCYGMWSSKQTWCKNLENAVHPTF